MKSIHTRSPPHNTLLIFFHLPWSHPALHCVKQKYNHKGQNVFNTVFRSNNQMNPITPLSSRLRLRSCNIKCITEKAGTTIWWERSSCSNFQLNMFIFQNLCFIAYFRFLRSTFLRSTSKCIANLSICTQCDAKNKKNCQNHLELSL